MNKFHFLEPYNKKKREGGKKNPGKNQETY